MVTRKTSKTSEKSAAKNCSNEWVSAIKEVALKTLAKGNLPFGMLCFTGILAIVCWRVNPDHWPQIISILVNNSLFEFGGWASALLTFCVWRSERGRYLRELERISNERNIEQRKSIPHMKSSKEPQVINIGEEKT